MKKGLIVCILLLGFNIAGIAQSVTPPAKKADEKIKADLAKPAATPLKVIAIPKTFSKVPPKDKPPMLAKPPADQKPKVVIPATPVVLKKDGTPDKRYNNIPANPLKKNSTPDLSYKKNKRVKSK
jgi:hypothetical protein